MSTDPTAEHIDAVARAIRPWAWETAPTFPGGRVVTGRRFTRDRSESRLDADRALTSTDPAVHAALAASLPAEAMLAALVDGGYCLVCGGMNGAHHAADDGLPCPEDPDAVLDEVAP